MNSLFIYFVILFSGLYFDRFDIFKIYIISTLIHEIAHIVAYRYFVKKWPVINISLFGYRMENNVTYIKNHSFIFLRGPLINIIIAVVSFYLILQKAEFKRYIWLYINLIIFTFNILPVYFLDGGQVLYRLSPFYQRNYIGISFLFVLLMSVMVITFTDDFAPVFIFLVYFLVNILNDI